MRAMVPVSVRAEEEHGALGNRISAMMAPLPVWCEDPVERLQSCHRGDGRPEGLRPGGRRRNPHQDSPTSRRPTIASQAARLQPAQRFFNLVVTNVPGPQFPLYVLGRQMESIFPMVPLARRQALCVGIMSYNGAGQLRPDRRLRRDGRPRQLRASTWRRRSTSCRHAPTARRRPEGGAPRSGATQPGSEPDRNGAAFGQVAPVESAGAEAVGAGVGVDQHRGDATEAAGVGQSRARHRAPRCACSAAATGPCRGVRRRPARPAPGRPSRRAGATAWTTTARPSRRRDPQHLVRWCGLGDAGPVRPFRVRCPWRGRSG